MDNLPEIKAHVHNTEISIFEKDNARAVVNLVPSVVKDSIEQWAFERDELFGLDEKDLYTKLKADNKQPSPTDNRLRLKFWNEYDRVQAQDLKMMNMVNVLSGICSREMFYSHYLKSPQKVAWLLTPPAGYMVKAEEALEFGLEQLRDLLDQPHVVNGKVDTKLGELKTKIVMMLDTRVKGAVIQKSMNLNLNTSNEKVMQAATAATAEDLMRQLKDLERKNRRAQNIPLEDSKGGKPDIEIS